MAYTELTQALTALSAGTQNLMTVLSRIGADLTTIGQSLDLNGFAAALESALSPSMKQSAR
jgi:hypothetical protein